MLDYILHVFEYIAMKFICYFVIVNDLNETVGVLNAYLYKKILELKNDSRICRKIMKIKKIVDKISCVITENSLYYKYQNTNRETGEIQYSSICCW